MAAKKAPAKAAKKAAKKAANKAAVKTVKKAPAKAAKKAAVKAPVKAAKKAAVKAPVKAAKKAAPYVSAVLMQISGDKCGGMVTHFPGAKLPYVLTSMHFCTDKPVVDFHEFTSLTAVKKHIKLHLHDAKPIAVNGDEIKGDITQQQAIAQSMFSSEKGGLSGVIAELKKIDSEITGTHNNQFVINTAGDVATGENITIPAADAANGEDITIPVADAATGEDGVTVDEFGTETQCVECGTDQLNRIVVLNHHHCKTLEKDSFSVERHGKILHTGDCADTAKEAYLQALKSNQRNA
jgi:hypothetical protein